MDSLTASDICDIAREVNRTMTNADSEWPDCHDAAARVQQRLLNQHDVDPSFVEIREYMLPDEYGHYALYVAPEVVGDGMIVDPSFAQFANETAAPVGIAPASGISDVACVQPASRYVFAEYESLSY